MPMVAYTVGTGLPCRVEGGCPDSFCAHPADRRSLPSLHEAALRRNVHEHDVHGYDHTVVETRVRTFNDPTGRSPAQRRALYASARELGRTSANTF